MRAILLLIGAASLLTGQGRDPFLGITRFRGTMTFSATASGTGIQGGTYSLTGEARATFLIERLTSGTTPSWGGRLISSSSSFTWDSTDGACNGTVKERFSASGPLQQLGTPVATDVRLNMNRSDWSFSISSWAGPRVTYDRVFECGPPNTILSRVEQYTGGLSIPRSITGLAYPSSGQSFRADSTYEDNVSYGTYVRPEFVVWKYSLDIAPDAGDLTLELTSDEWQKWRPTAERDGSAGKPLEVTATVKRADGTPAPEDVQSFEWELVETSREPGIAINWPTEAKANDKKEYDLRFEPQGDQVATTPDNQKLIRPVRNTAQDKAVINPFDWGGWSTLKVTAILRDGRRLTGRFQGANEDDMRLPKRRPSSLIADDWLAQWNITGKGDESDDDEEPKGDGNAGDGLTLYEEYRGFYENRRHGEGNPMRKDYFAVNKAGSEVEVALAHFRTLTGLVVHPRVLRTETDSERVINGNYDSSPHRVDQHAVVYQNAGYSGLSRAVGGPSTPKDIQYVGIQTRFPAAPTFDANVDYATSTIAHEALHSVNVWHHGRGDKEVFWNGGGGVLLENAVAIIAKNEAGTDITAAQVNLFGIKGETLTLGVVGGQHSGVEDCVMRYDNAYGYVSKAEANVRYVPDAREIAGAQLCDGKEGTSTNASGHTPQSRFGSATNGHCRSQILVNDLITAPKR